jgi:phage terminase small subunit
MGVSKRLTEMQKRFAEFVVFGGTEGPMTQGEAAIAAGYAKDSARVEGSQLLNPRYSPLVVQYVGRLREERLEKHKVGLEDMSELELENKMKQILDDYAPILNITPETKKLSSKTPDKPPAKLKENISTSNEKPELEDKEPPTKTPPSQ